MVEQGTVDPSAALPGRGDAAPVGTGPTLSSLAIGMGAASIVVGLVVLLWPRATLLVVAVLFGVQLVVSGIRRLAVAVSTPALAGWVRALVAMSGVLELLIGLVCLRNPFASVALIAVLVSIGWLLDGVSDLVAAWSAPGRGSTWLHALGGLLSIAAAVAILYWPALSLATLLLVGGWMLIAMGVAQVASGIRLRRAASA